MHDPRAGIVSDISIRHDAPCSVLEVWQEVLEQWLVALAYEICALACAEILEASGRFCRKLSTLMWQHRHV